MAQFTNLYPASGQEDVTRTTVIRFTITDDSYGVLINSLNVTLNGIDVIDSGNFVNSYRGSIYSPIGKYIVGIYPKSPSFLPYAADINVNLYVNDTVEGPETLNYHFYIDGYNPAPIPPEPVGPTGSRACIKDKPEFFPLEVGAQWAYDTGIGTQIELQWKEAAPYILNDFVFYNIYYSSEREQVFKSLPEFLVDGFEATLGGFTPGDSVYLGVRAAEFGPSWFTTNGLIQAGPNMYFYPITSLSSAITTSSMSIPVDSSDGFPVSGILLIGTELIRYSSISSNNFIVSAHGRGIDDTVAEAHALGDEVRMYQGSEDDNVRLITVTPSFQKPNYALTWELGDGYGDDGYRSGFDGYGVDGYDGYYRYRQEKYDSLTSNGTDNDSSGEFPRLDYCATYRGISPKNYMKGQCINSYFGGVQARFDAEGNRYLVKVTDVQTHMLQREELLLETTGEPFVLLRRMWTGMRCMCTSLRQEHPDARCPVCFSTGFTMGYNQILNPRRADRRILIRVEPVNDDLKIDQLGMEPVIEPSCWTITFPMIKDRDVLVRFNYEDNETERYEVLAVDRVKSMFGQTGVQKFKMKKIPKTDIIYQFPIIRKYYQYPNMVSTSIDSGPGLIAHSHEIAMPVGIIDYSRLKVATLESQGHNHIIINGNLYSVLNHTHTLPLL